MVVGVLVYSGGMGKREKQKQKQKHDRTQRGRDYYLQENDTAQPFSSTSTLSPADNEEEEEEAIDDADSDNNNNEQHPSHDMPSKFLLYQQSVQVSVF